MEIAEPPQGLIAESNCREKAIKFDHLRTNSKLKSEGISQDRGSRPRSLGAGGGFCAHERTFRRALRARNMLARTEIAYAPRGSSRFPVRHPTTLTAPTSRPLATTF